MAKHFLVALTNAVEGQEDEFREWYSNTHLRDLLAVPGCRSAKFFGISHTQRIEPPYPFTHMAIYEIDSDDIQGFLDELDRRRGGPEMQISDALSPTKLSLFFAPITSMQAG